MFLCIESQPHKNGFSDEKKKKTLQQQQEHTKKTIIPTNHIM